MQGQSAGRHKVLCKNIEILGFCRFADSCKFAHSTEDLADDNAVNHEGQELRHSEAEWATANQPAWVQQRQAPVVVPPLQAQAASEWAPASSSEGGSYASRQSDWSDWSDWSSWGSSSKKAKTPKLRSTGQICVGRIKLLRDNHGFIKCDDVKDQFGGADVFCGDFSQLSGRTVGELVTFDLVLNKEGKPQACNIKDGPAEFTSVEDFAAKNMLDAPCIEILHKQAEHVQQGVMKMGPVTNTTGGDPISIITSRIKKVAAKQMFDCRKVQEYDNPEDIANAVRIFCAENGLDQDCTDRLARSTPEVQKLVVAGGHVAGSKNPSAMVMGRIAKAQNQCRPPPQVTLPPANLSMQAQQVAIPPPPAPGFGLTSAQSPNFGLSSNTSVSFTDIASDTISSNMSSPGIATKMDPRAADLDFLIGVQFDEPAYKRQRTDIL